MGAVLYLGVGLAMGLFVAWLLWWQGRRENLALDEDKQRLQDERKIVAGFMHDLVEAIGRGVSRDELLQQVVGAAVASSGAMSACVFSREGHRLRGVAIQGLFPPHRPLPATVRHITSSRANFLEQVLRAEVFEVGEGLVGLVAQTDQGILIADAEGDPRVIKHEDPALRVRSVIVVPISFRETNLAVLAIVNRADGMPFDDVDYSLVTALAEQAALALQNLLLMDLQIERNRLEADLSLASNIQGLLLPSTFPSIPGLSLAALYEPAQKVGGDLYDLVKLDENRYGVAVADVSGKGIPASLIMAIAQSNLGNCARHSAGPRETLRALNEVLHSETRPEMYVTMVYAMIDLAAQTITIARAGHEAPLLRREQEGGRIHAVKSRGIALGLIGDHLFSRTIEEITYPFVPGDALLLYTDGILEEKGPANEEFGSKRLVELLDTLHQGTPEAINRGIREAVARWANGKPQIDDLTLLCVKRVREVAIHAHS